MSVISVITDFVVTDTVGAIRAHGVQALPPPPPPPRNQCIASHH
jgi:hypothetical protein